MVARPRLHPATHPYIKRAHELKLLTYAQLALMFGCSPKRIQQIATDIDRVKVDGRWTNRKRGEGDGGQ